MVHSLGLVVLEEEHVADEAVDGLLEVEVALLLLTREESFDLTLGGELWLHLPDVVVHVVEEGVLDVGDGVLAVEPTWILFMVVVEQTKTLLEKVVVDERLDHKVLLEGKTVALDFAGRHRQRGSELAQESVDGVGRDLPDAEEAEDVVDAISREVLLHLAEALEPPLEAVLEHGIPVVGGETPVLTVGREWIGWCTCRTIHIEVERLDPSLDRGAADADGDVALEDNIVLTGIGRCIEQLDVQLVLYIVVEANLMILGGLAVGEGIDLLLLIYLVLGPFTEVGSSEGIAEHREGGIGTQPLFVVLEEGLEAYGAEALLSLLLVDVADVGTLGVVDAFVVNLLEGIEFDTLCLVIGSLLFVLEGRKLAQVEILRMEGVDRDGVVGIGVSPGAGDGGVVDGEDLYGLLVSEYSPVDKTLEVAKVTYAEAAFAAQGEDGHGYTSHTTSVVPGVVEVELLLTWGNVLDDVCHAVALLTRAEAVAIDAIAIEQR